ncbi:MAG: hypothetical protein ACRDRC_00325 [Pseudonocardiaceae bacterium]
MRHLRSTVAGLALLGALMACAHRPQQVGFGGDPQPLAPVSGASVAMARGETVPDWPDPPPGARALPSAQIDSSALPPGYPRLVWTQGDGRPVGLHGQEGGCTHVHADLREQTARLVRVALVEITSKSGPCTMDLRFPPLAVRLDAPLGDRTVVLERQTSGPLQPRR